MSNLPGRVSLWSIYVAIYHSFNPNTMKCPCLFSPRRCLFSRPRSLLVGSCLQSHFSTLRPRNMTMTPDTSPRMKRLSIEEPSSPEPLKRTRLDTTERSDAQPESSTGEKHPGKRDPAGWAKSRRGKEKQTKNVGRRRGPRHTEPSETPKNQDEEGPRPPRLPKRMTALLLGFCGSGCSGMQMCVRFVHVERCP